MNTDTVKGKFKQVSGEVQRQWGKLTNDDMDVIQGDAKKLSGKLQEHYGYSKEEAEKHVSEWMNKA